MVYSFWSVCVYIYVINTCDAAMTEIHQIIRDDSVSQKT